MLPYLRCLTEDEANYPLREVHEGICGDHLGARSFTSKILIIGYYWPTMKKDAFAFVQVCDKCQRFANLTQIPTEVLTPITSSWPFA